MLRLFVYGTLMRGGEAHERLCGGWIEATAARIPGRLETVPGGYRALVVSAEQILRRGSADPDADLAARDGLAPTGRIAGAPWVDGDLLTLPGDRLAALDDYEGFVAAADGCLYDRVLVLVERRGDPRPVAAWTYVRGRRSR